MISGAGVKPECRSDADGMGGRNAASVPLERRRKSVARLYAVQALFQIEASGQSVETVEREFENHRFGALIDNEELAAGDTELFRTLISRAVSGQKRIDRLISGALAEDWPMNRIDPTLRALFRAAGAELEDGGIDPKVVISEFVCIAEAFFPEEKAPRFVNAVLDNMARAARPEAF